MSLFSHFMLRWHRHFRVSPALPMLLFYLAGLLGPIFNLNLFSRSLLFLFCFLLTWTGLRQRYSYYCPFFLIGLIWGHIFHHSPWQTYLSFLPRAECRAIICARVASNPGVSSRGASSLPVRALRRETIAIQGIFLDGRWQPCAGKVLLQFDPFLPMPLKHLPDLQHGDTFVLEGVFLQPPGALEADFPHHSWRRHLRSLGIQRLFWAQVEHLYLPATGWHRWRQQFLRCRHYLSFLLKDGISNDAYAALYQAMLLGSQDGMPRELRTKFIHSATIHIFSISGLHVSSIMALTLLFLRCLLVSFRRRWLLLIPLLGVYIFLAGCAPSAVRSFWMSFTVGLAIIRFRPAAAHNSLALSGLFLLLYNPYYLLHLGFLYSFTLVAVLLYGWPLLSRLAAIIHERNLWLPLSYQHRWLRLPYQWFIAALLTSVLAWLGSAGLNLYCNGLCTVGSLLVNMLLIPITGGLIFLAFPKCLIAIFCSSWSWLLGKLISWLFTILIILAEVGSQPFSAYFFQQPSVCWLLSFYLLLLLLFSFRSFWLHCLVGASLLTCFINATWFGQKAKTPRILLCQGNDGAPPTICLRMPAEKSPVILYPGGKSSAGTMVQALASRGVRQVGKMYLPNCNASTAGAFAIANRLQPKAMILPPPEKCYSRTMARLITISHAQGSNHSHLQPTTKLMVLHQDSKSQYLAPEKNSTPHGHLIFAYQDVSNKLQVTMIQTVPGKHLLEWHNGQAKGNFTLQTARQPLVIDLKMAEQKR